ncbi:MAG: LemA family protein [Crocinitomicaceae bacterium]|jgi:LemA protein|nr:LemA family protein [Crocinitomicaceae bacterium]
MKKSTIILLSVVGLFVLVLGNGCSSYNSMSSQDEGITQQWKQVEVAYQARMDKTKNLLAIVQKAANFEKGTLKEVMEARAAATQVKINVDQLTPENVAKFQKAQDAFGSSLGRLMAVAENYPQLQTVGAFRDFQAQYEGMENRIATERRYFNEAVGSYNTSIRRLPRKIWASMFDFERRGYFEASRGASNAPDISNM